VIDSTQILSELDFLNFLAKRKIDPIWKEIQYIQLYVRIKVKLRGILIHH